MDSFYIETYGCQMNEADSDYMAAVLLSLGMKSTPGPETADLVLVNTCSIREKAAAKVLSFLGRVKPHKKKKDMVIGVCGCVARQEGHELIKQAPFVDIVFGPHHIDRLPEFLDRVGRKEQVVEVSDKADMGRDSGLLAPTGLRALVPVMQGCDNFCSFCVVPHVRGREKSRLSGDILNEARSLAAKGIREIMFLGQNVNSYGNDLGMKDGFVALIRQAAQVDGISRIRFTTSHPKDLTDRLIGCFGEIGALCPQMHLPVQAGSDAVLSRMNRKYDRAGYLRKVELLRRTRPDIAVTTDIIVGFPGESDADFEDTMSLVREVRYDGAFSFKYSKRPGTRAAEMEDQVPDNVKQERLEQLQELQKAITYEKNAALAGRVIPVLVEERSRRDNGEYSGRTPCFRIVNFSGGSEDIIGRTINVTITRGLKNSLKGVAAEERV